MDVFALWYKIYQLFILCIDLFTSKYILYIASDFLNSDFKIINFLNNIVWKKRTQSKKKNNYFFCFKQNKAYKQFFMQNRYGIMVDF